MTSNGSLRAAIATHYEVVFAFQRLPPWAGKVPAGKVVNEPLHMVDWYPTLLKLTGPEVEQKLPLDGLCLGHDNQHNSPRLTKSYLSMPRRIRERFA